MNPLKKAYCRTYQAMFHLALPVLPYREPELFHTLNELEPLFLKKGWKHVLLVTDRTLREAGITAAFESLLKQWGVHAAVYDKTAQNPTVNNVEEARSLYLAEGCEALVAFGGGSSIDCAKAVGARIAYPQKTLGQLKGTLRVLRPIPTLIAIPTTAGTGSEVTLAAVITDSDAHHKYTLNDFTLIPSYAVLDPAVTYSLPPALTATTGMDALTHAVEAYIGRSTSKKTRAMAEKATELIFQNIERAYQNGKDREARSAMLRASYLAGNAFSQSYVGYIHAIAHSLGGQYNLPHGLTNAVLMPYVLEAYGSAAAEKLHRLGMAAGVSDPADSPETGAKKFIEAIRELNRRMGIPETLPSVREEDIPVMAAHADREANPLYPVPLLMDREALTAIYRKIMKESNDHEPQAD